MRFAICRGSIIGVCGFAVAACSTPRVSETDIQAEMLRMDATLTAVAGAYHEICQFHGPSAVARAHTLDELRSRVILLDHLSRIYIRAYAVRIAREPASAAEAVRHVEFYRSICAMYEDLRAHGLYQRTLDGMDIIDRARGSSSAAAMPATP